MADELDSGSSVGYYVWVQVPSSALYMQKLRRDPEFFSYTDRSVSCPQCSRSTLRFGRRKEEI